MILLFFLSFNYSLEQSLWFCFSSFHSLTFQSKIQFDDTRLCLKILYDSWKKSSNRSFVYNLFLRHRHILNYTKIGWKLTQVATYHSPDVNIVFLLFFFCCFFFRFHTSYKGTSRTNFNNFVKAMLAVFQVSFKSFCSKYTFSKL